MQKFWMFAAGSLKKINENMSLATKWNGKVFELNKFENTPHTHTVVPTSLF
jgi:hypothetical protein